MSESGSSTGQALKKLPWVILLVIVGLIAYSVYSGLDIGKVEMPGGFSVEFRERKSPTDPDDQLAQLTDDERTQAQAELEAKVREMEERLRAAEQQSQQQAEPPSAFQAGSEAPVVAPSRPAAVAVDINGRWQSAEGLTYSIQQNGNSVLLQEINPFYQMVTAAGQGTLIQRTVDLTYWTIFNTMGRASLQVSEDGRSISGNFTDQTTGIPIPISLVKIQ